MKKILLMIFLVLSFLSLSSCIEKIKECEEYSFAKDYTVDRNFIDINNHMNNVCYMELADIALPENVYLKGDCNEFEIMYRKAIKYGEKIKCLYTEIEDSHIIAIKSEDLSELKAIIKIPIFIIQPKYKRLNHCVI